MRCHFNIITVHMSCTSFVSSVSDFHFLKDTLLCELSGLTEPTICDIYVTRYEKKGELTEKHILQDCRKCLPAHANVLFALYLRVFVVVYIII